MAFVALPEDIYAGGPSNDLLRFWLSQTIDRERAEASLSTPSYAPSGSFIVRRSITSKGNYAITVCEGRKIKSYKVHDLGMGQVGLSSGQAFASLEHLLEFFYEEPFPEPGDGHVPLRIMHQHLLPPKGGMPGGMPPMAAPPMMYGDEAPPARPPAGIPMAQAPLMYGDDGPPAGIPMAGQPLMYGDEDGRAPAVPPPRPEQTYDTAESTYDTADQLPGGQFAYGGGAAPTYGEASSSAGYVYGDNGDSVYDTAEGGLPMPQARPPMTYGDDTTYG